MTPSLLKKHILPLLCAGLLLVSAAGCSDIGQGNSLGDASSQPTVSAEASPSETPAPSGTPTPSKAPVPSPENSGAAEESKTKDGGAGSSESVDTSSPAPIRAKTAFKTCLYSQPQAGRILEHLEKNWEFDVFPTDDPLWYSIVLDNGDTAYLYGETLLRAEGDAQISLTQEYLKEKFADLQKRLPEGKYWNHMFNDQIPYGQDAPDCVTDTPCEHSQYGELYCNFYSGSTSLVFSGSSNQCLGFASYLSDQAFGRNAPIHLFYDYKLLRTGDHIRFDEYEHSLTVTEITEDHITVAEVNQNYENCLISWSRQISKDELVEYAWDLEFISRYPMLLNEKGDYAAWPEGYPAYYPKTVSDNKK